MYCLWSWKWVQIYSLLGLSRISHSLLRTLKTQFTILLISSHGCSASIHMLKFAKFPGFEYLYCQHWLKTINQMPTEDRFHFWTQNMQIAWAGIRPSHCSYLTRCVWSYQIYMSLFPHLERKKKIKNFRRRTGENVYKAPGL